MSNKCLQSDDAFEGISQASNSFFHMPSSNAEVIHQMTPEEEANKLKL
jgi:hypothetical protein